MLLSASDTGAACQVHGRVAGKIIEEMSKLLAAAVPLDQRRGQKVMTNCVHMQLTLRRRPHKLVEGHCLCVQIEGDQNLVS